MGARSLKVTGIVVGGIGLLERFGVGAPTSTARIRARDVVPWREIVRADRRGVIVRDGARPVRS
jgi:hypothetical protein